MPNPFFAFKKFTVYQDRSAMKVSTDACILGAWFAHKIRDYSYILDIGSGTGLLMLMLAQKLKSEIHGIEIDLESFRQGKENIERSAYKSKCRIMIGDARTYVFPCKYDFIISNPPFYEHQLQSMDERRNQARHSSLLRLDELMNVSVKNLSDDGAVGLLLPYYRTDECITIAGNLGLHVSETLSIRESADTNYTRSILHFTRLPVHPRQSHSLTIRDENEAYSQAFTELLADYYLYL